MKAFPHTYDQIIDGHVATCTNYGMDLRDYFAAMALTTFPIEIKPVNTTKSIAEKCYVMADEMMKAREK